MNKHKFNDLLGKLAAEEVKFFGSDFLSPVIRNVPIRVKLSNVIMNLEVAKPRNFVGWGVFRPQNSKTADFVRTPSMAERRQYLDLFPVLRLIVCARKDDTWLGIPAHMDTRFKVQGLVPIRLAEEVQMFTTVITRFDGANCWHDSNDSNANLKNAVVLRDALAAETESDKIVASGLTKEEKHAYAIAFLRDVEAKKDRKEERIKLAIQRAGGEYRSYLERDNTYTVEYVVDGEAHKSVINKDTLQVQSAGICLSGGDSSFDLQSLVGVVRDGIRTHRINRVGLNTDVDYDDYDD